MWWRWILAFSWELPQTLVGLLALIFSRRAALEPEYLRFAVVLWREVTIGSGGSFGALIVLDPVYSGIHGIAEHEHGHSIQSLLLGPLYLFAVGIPSLVNNVAARAGRLSWDEYFDRYPERWANRLGGADL